MQARPQADLEQQYTDLTEKQQAIVDAHAENPTATNREKARIAGEEILGTDEPVNESYASQVLNQKYPRVAEYRAEIVQNERQAGEVTTEGDPFAGLTDQQETTWQGIKERPTKDPQQETTQAGEHAQHRTDSGPDTQPDSQHIHTTEPVDVQAAADGIYVRFDQRYLRELLESQELPPALHQRLVDVVLRQAFE
jgi:hypothetical protein